MTAVADSRRTWAIAALLGSYAALLALASDTRMAVALAVPLIVIPLLWWTIQTPARWLAAFFFCSLLLPPLPIAIGDSGPHVALVFAAVGLLAGLLRLADWRIPSGSLPLSMVIFAAARDGRDQFRPARAMFLLAVASALFACLDFYFQFPAPAGYGAQFVWLDSGVFRRAQGVFYEASTLGNLCAFFLVMIAVAVFRPKQTSPLSRRAMFLGGAILAAALVFSYSRGSLLNLFASVAALLYLNRSRLNFRRLAAAVFLSVAAVVIIVYTLFPQFALNYWTRLWLSGQYFFSATNGILSGRLDSWRVLGGFLIGQPWHAALGIGYKTLPYSDFIGHVTIADNMYLGLLVETGILGLGVFLVFNIAVLRAALKAARSMDTRRTFFGTWIFCFWIGEMVQMLSGDLFTYWRVLPVYFWVLALAVKPETP